MKKVSALPLEQVAMEFLAPDDHPRKIRGRTRATPECLHDPSQNTIIQQCERSHSCDEEALLQVCCARQACHYQHSALFSRKVDSVITACNDRHGLRRLDKCLFRHFNISRFKSCEANLLLNPLARCFCSEFVWNQDKRSPSLLDCFEDEALS